MRSALLIVAATTACLGIASCQKPATASPAAPAAAPTTAPMTAAPMTATAPTAAAPAAGANGASASGRMAGLPKLRVACAADIQKFCAGSSEKPGKCLKPHRAELSQPCSQAIAARRAARMAMKNAGGGAGAAGAEE